MKSVKITEKGASKQEENQKTSKNEKRRTSSKQSDRKAKQATEKRRYEKVIIGIDAHMKQCHVTIIADGQVVKRLTVENDGKNLSRYVKEKYPSQEYLAGYEAGYTGFNLYRELESNGIKTIVINPADIPTTDKESKRKTDRSDSLKIAQSLQAGTVTGIYVPDREQQSDRSITRVRRDIVKEIGRIKSQIKASLAQIGIKEPERFLQGKKCWSRNYMAWLEEIIEELLEFEAISLRIKIEFLKVLRKKKLEVDRSIRELSKRDKYRKLCQVLMSTPGIGLTISMVLLTEIGDINRFKSFDRFASYLAMTPTEHSSGSRQRTGRMIKRGRLYIRSLIIEAAWIVIRNDEEMNEYYQEKKKYIGWQKAIVCVAKKLLSRIYHIWRNQEPYKANKAA